jgi:hypothetical protein
MRVCLYVLAAAAFLLAAMPAGAVNVRDGWVDGRGWHQATKNPQDCKIAPTKTVDANGDVVLRPARRCDLGTQPKEGEAK